MKISRTFKWCVIIGFLLWVLSLLASSCTCPPCPTTKVVIIHDTIKVYTPILFPLLKPKVIL